VVHAGPRGSPPSGAAPKTSCAQLTSLALTDATITAAEEITTGEYVPTGQEGRGGGANPLTNLPAFCRVAVTVTPAIKIEVWMPRDTWNGRYVGEGGGGYAGTISYAALANRIRGGYAAASTDTGHAQGGGSFAVSPDGSLNMGLIKDFSERSLHEMVLKAKSLINAYYGSPPVHTYWNGCSTGGRQGLMAVQRFPEQYDGLVIGAPAINWDRFVPSELWPQIVMKELVGAPISAAKLNAATAAAVSACDAKDGVSDGVIDDPRACSYDPAALVCKPESVTSTCLSTAEADAIRKIWAGPSTASGDRLWFGLEQGAPLASLAGGMPFGIGTDHFRYWLRQDPNFDWHALTIAQFERDFRESQRKFHDVIGTDEANLFAFRQRGGKMIMWHGEADQLIFPRGTINYFNRVLEANGGPAEVSRFARLYMAPGVGHCGGGVGPAPTGMFEAVVDWVEKGVPPATILAANTPGRGAAPDVPSRTRPLCPYPTIAKWTGTGSTDEAANFACVASNPRASDFTVR
jgi:pimeloyl-ACP methyl ester carboxylesterase